MTGGIERNLTESCAIGSDGILRNREQLFLIYEPTNFTE